MAVSALLAPLLGLLLLSAPLVPAFSASQPASAGPDGVPLSGAESGSEAGSCRLHRGSGIVILASSPLHGPGTCGETEADTLVDSAGPHCSRVAEREGMALGRPSWTSLTGGWGAWDTWGGDTFYASPWWP